MIDKQELVATLKSQHHELRINLTEALQNAQNIMLDETVEVLGRFKNNLKTHLELENSTFYPDYLAMNSANDQIKKFINEMIVIGEKVMAFLDKYDKVEKIAFSGEKFIMELKNITDVLNLRIEMEENELYNLYVLTK